MARALAGDKEAWKQLQAESDARIEAASKRVDEAIAKLAVAKANSEAATVKADAARAELDRLLGPDQYEMAAEVQKRRAAIRIVED